MVCVDKPREKVYRDKRTQPSEIPAKNQNSPCA